MKMRKNTMACFLLTMSFVTSLSLNTSDLETQIENEVKSDIEFGFVSSFHEYAEKNSIGDLRWMVGGEGIRSMRSYWLHVPPDYSGSTPVPLVIILHGATVFNVKNPFWFFTNSIMESYSGMSAKADQEGFIAVYPNAKLLWDKENSEAVSYTHLRAHET